jgi:heptosyltransferase-2
MKILVIQTAFIGDVILATGILEKLHQKFPQSQLDFMIRKGNESLLEGHIFIANLLIWDKQNQKYTALWQLLKKIRATKYDLIINLQRFASMGFLTAFSGAKETIGFDKNPFSFLFSKKIKHIISENSSKNFIENIHEIERNHALIADLTDNVAHKPRLYPQEKDYLFVKPYQTSNYVCFAPTSVWFTKQFPLERWAEVAQKINEIYNKQNLQNVVIYLLGAKSDQKKCEEIAQKITENLDKNITTSTNAIEKVVNLAGKLNLLQSAALMQFAKMNFVNDSAPMHLASALNAPTRAFYCSTLPAFGFYPLSDDSKIIELEQKLACRPCGLHGHAKCPEKHFKCAFEIVLDEKLA